MTEAKHTPGPWEHWTQGGNFSVTGPAAAAAMTATRAIDESGYGHFVECASRFGESPAIALGDTKERAEANARLISVAPEMLERLEMCKRFLEDMHTQSPEVTVAASQTLHETVSEIIAKATGK